MTLSSLTDVFGNNIWWAKKVMKEKHIMSEITSYLDKHQFNKKNSSVLLGPLRYDKIVTNTNYKSLRLKQ